MKNQAAWLAFLLVVLGDLAGIYLDHEMLRFVFKPLIVPAVGWLFLNSSVRERSYRTPLLIALFFSWLGDILLMFDAANEIYFLLGLSAFLVAHLFYIGLFHRIRTKMAVPWKPWLFLPVVAYYIFLILLVSPYLGDKEWPVRVYGMVISFMLLLALHLVGRKTGRAGSLICAGAFLFVISDSVLAINKFYMTFAGAGLLVMATYAAGQVLIAVGVARFTRDLQKL